MSKHTDPSVKHDALLIFDAVDSNPNGDPDNAGKPRVDLDSGHGLVSDASLKRKIRDTVAFRVEQELLSAERNAIFIRRGVALNDVLEKAYADLKIKPDKKAPAADIQKAAAHMIENYFDVRMFGAVMSTGKASAGKVTGPVTVGIGRSVDPVLPIEMAITRTASTKTEDKDNASQMGNKSFVPYGLYTARIHYQPTRDNRVTSEDLDVLWSTLATMFELTRSAARPDVSTRNLFVFSSDGPLGSAPARALFDRIKIEKSEGVEVPTTADDYKIELPNVDELPNGVTGTRVV